MKLFAFPHAGAYASYYNFLKKLPEEVSVQVYEYPGRGRRFDDPVFGTFGDAVKQIAGEIREEAGEEPYALYGNCMGAVYAYETALRMEEEYARPPVLVIVSGQVPPEYFAPPAPFDNDDDFLQYMIAHNGIEGTILDNGRMLKAFLPQIRVDAERLHSWKMSVPEKPLDTAMAVFYGASDPTMSMDVLEGWGAVCRKFLGVYPFPGDHFYLHGAEDQEVSKIRELLEGLGT